MSYLATKVTEYFQFSQYTMRQFEELAGLPRMTIGTIINNAHPRPERLGQLLRVLPPLVAQEWLIAYLRDDVPDEWQDRVQILINTAGLTESAVLAETPTEYGQPCTATALDRLIRAMERDPELGDWFVRTVNLILGPESPDGKPVE